MAERVEAVVVGAGPAGSACALALARRNIGVTLVERARFPRRKVCGEYLSGGAVAALEELGVGEKVRASAQPLAGVRLAAGDAPLLELPFAGGALALARETLDTLLLDAARAAGARLVLGRAEDLLFAGGRVAGIVMRDETAERRELQARFVVGADGNGSMVARKLGLTVSTRRARRFALGGHYQGLGDLQGFVEMYVGAAGYLALNPLDVTRTNVMVVVPERALGQWPGALDESVYRRARELSRGRCSLGAAQRIGPRVAAGPLDSSVRTSVAPGALLAGDAAGMLDPFTGQGVCLALRGGLEAAAVLAGVLSDPVSEEQRFAEYAARRRREAGGRRRLSQLVALLCGVPFLTRRAEVRLRRFPALAERLMAALGGTLAPERVLSPLVLRRLLL